MPDSPLFIALTLTNWANFRGSRHAMGRLKRTQQDELRRQLDLRATRPGLPCTVELRPVVARLGSFDDDGRIDVFKYMRDTIARWLHRLPETVPRVDAWGHPVIKNGKLQMTRPHAPDGAKSGITWVYLPERRSDVLRVVPGKRRRQRVTGIEIIFR